MQVTTQKEQAGSSLPRQIDMLRSSSLQPAALLSQAREPPSGWPSEAKQCDEQGCWPKLFILGTQKGATTSLFQLLHNEGSACGSITNQRIESALPNLKGAFNGDTGMAKEPHIFDIVKPDWQKVAKEPGLYRSLYRVSDCPQRTFLDATPNYIHHPGAPSRLAELLPTSWVPHLRMVLTVREPIARDLSWFNHRSAQSVQPGQDRSNMKYTFCSVSDAQALDKNFYPSYEGEVECRKQELDNCLTGARRRLDKGEALSQNASRGSGQMARPPKMKSTDADSWLEEDYRECVAAYEEGGWDEEDGKYARDPPLLTWGMYLPQLLAWSRRVSRGQILVLNFERLVDQPGDVLPRVTSFMGLPDLQDNTLPHSNELPYDRKVDVISCKTSQLLGTVFKGWNEQFVAQMRADHDGGHAPPQEPRFDGFDTTVPCEEHEHVVELKTSADGSVVGGPVAGVR